MKKCSYCGQEYPDEAKVCATDGEPLSGTIPGTIEPEAREKVTGVWRGVYGYGERETSAGLVPVAFTLKLKQGWLTHFTGSVMEDAPRGTPGKGIIDGYFQSPAIEFNKQMPVGYGIGPDGTRITLREYFLAKGYACERDLPSPPIFYQGNFLDSHRVQGTWLIQSRKITLPGGPSVTMPGIAGFWCAEFITADPKIDPAGGPTGPLFDKTLLSPRELEEVEGVPYRSLGKYNVADAEKFLDRFGQADLRFELKRDDTPMHQMMPITAVTGGYSGSARLIEIFIHPDDEPKARAIINEDNQV